MALTSACAVGSRPAVTWLLPRATISPPLAIRAPKGPPPLRTLVVASSMALSIQARSNSRMPVSRVSVVMRAPSWAGSVREYGVRAGALHGEDA